MIREKTLYKLKKDEFGKRLRIALVSDLHSKDGDGVISMLREEAPDLILIPGDVFDHLGGVGIEENENGYAFLSAAADIAPSFFSLGNHENGGVRSWLPTWKYKEIESVALPEEIERIKSCGVTLLDDEYVMHEGIAIGGLTSGLINKYNLPRLDWLEGFEALDAPKLLLCHHPEYYKKYLRGRDISLIVSGHAHGGQWRIFGRGVFAPGQGIFPKYTSGVFDDTLVVSRGAAKSGRIPRFFNRCHVIFIEVN